MKDFDESRQAREARERTFKIGGEEFTFRPAVTPEALLPYNRAITGESKPTEEDWIAIYDETIRALLEPGQDERWAHVRGGDLANPLNVQDINELLQWLLEQQTDRPTGQPSDSSTSSGGNGAGSKAVSSPEAVPSPASPSAKPAT